jgi:general stress protein 26
MNEIKGMKDEFKRAKLVYLSTFSEDNVKRNRAMTNYNEDPYSMMWFPTFKDTQKVRDIQNNPRVLVTFPSSKRREFYEIEGRAELEVHEVVNEKWEWWYLFWLPDEEFQSRIMSDAPFKNHAIINVYPESARIVKPDTVYNSS